jgi:hypothetical protein
MIQSKIKNCGCIIRSDENDVPFQVEYCYDHANKYGVLSIGIGGT